MTLRPEKSPSTVAAGQEVESRTTAPDVRIHLLGLVGTTIPTISGTKTNDVLAIDGQDVVVGTSRSPQGAHVPIAEVQAAVDLLWQHGEISVKPSVVGYRSAFIGAVLQTMKGVEVFRRPQTARLTARQRP